MLPHWWSSTKRFSHVWLQTTCESRNILKSFYTLATYVWWQFLRICKSIFGVFFLGGWGKGHIFNKILLYENIFPNDESLPWKFFAIEGPHYYHEGIWCPHCFTQSFYAHFYQSTYLLFFLNHFTHILSNHLKFKNFSVGICDLHICLHCALKI
jgi:hypothetical protein